MTGPAPAGAAAAARERVWELLETGERTVLVDSPPGAGKSTLVLELAARLAATGEQVPVVAQTNDQADDLAYAAAHRLAGSGATAGRLHGSDWSPPRRPAPEGLVSSRAADELAGCSVLVATAAKWAYVTEGPGGSPWPLAIVDEAYQMSSAALVRVAGLFDRLLMVGDPGQLAPFTVADERAVRRLASWPLDTAAGTLLRSHPATSVVPLPVSWRLPPAAATVVGRAFYTRPFAAGVPGGVRRLWFEAPPMPDPVGRALAGAAGSGWGLLELAAAHLPRTDPEAVSTIADLVARLLGSGPVVADEHGERRLVAAGVAVGVTHRDQRALLRSALDDRGLGEVVVDTANRLQGRQFEMTVVWHPLSGRRDASAFHLEAGRLCVLASRHRHACVVVTRAGVREQLDAYPATEPVWLGEDPPQVDGWEAHHTFLDALADHVVER